MRSRRPYFPAPIDYVLGALVFAGIVGLAVISCTEARAATNSVQICRDPTMVGHVAQDCIASLKWDIPGINDLVLTRPPTSTEQWGNTTTWQLLHVVAPPAQIRTCPLDLALPAIHGNGIPDPCGSSQVWVTAPSGQSVRITCTPPTTNTDATPIGPTQLPLSFYFWEGLMPGPVYRQVSPLISGCDYTFPNLEAGNHYFVAITQDALGARSGSSNEATKTVLAPGQAAPNPPTALMGTVPASTPLAYTLATTNESLFPFAIGTAKPGAHCDMTQSFTAPTAASGATQYRVNVADVDLKPGVNPIVAFTTCN
ncbi:MAG TPA: hypothetical protein VE907_06400 [Gammaproteobacteria bacterium]|nr:hypothetical protein [Gammaproteobacteria bacterium]